MQYQKKQLINGVIWSGIDKLGVVVVQLLLEIILARHLLPRDYGIIGMATIFIALGSLFSESGFSNALIQKQDRNERDFSTAFYFNLIVSFVFVLIIFFIAPFAADFFETPILKSVLRILSLSIIFNALVMVHKTKLSINLDFKTQAKISFISLIVSGCLGVFLAIKDYGVWALVAQTLTQSFISVILFFGFLRWTPLRVFSKESFAQLFKFGSKILAAGLLQATYTNLFYLFIGKKMTASSLGLYTKSNQFTYMPISILSGVLQRVTFPFFSTSQNNNHKLFKLNQEFTKLICIVVFPVFIYLSIFSESLVYFGLSEKWIQTAVIIKILALSVIFFPISVNNMILFQVKNKPTQFLYLEIVSKVLGVLIFLLAINYGIIALCLGLLLQQILQFIISSLCVQYLLNEKLFSQILLVFPYLVFSGLIWCVINYIQNNMINDYLQQLMIGTLIFIVYYISIYLLFLRNTIKSLIELLKNK